MRAVDWSLVLLLVVLLQPSCKLSCIVFLDGNMEGIMMLVVALSLSHLVYGQRSVSPNSN